MRYFFPLHYDSGNRGCEAIARSSAILLNAKKENIISYSRDTTLDNRLGLGQYMELVPTSRDSFVIDKLLGLLNKIFINTRIRLWRNIYPYLPFFRLIDKEDVVFSTGGDMMCYDNCEAVYTNNYAHSKGNKTILWGCSMGPENLTKEKEESLARFSLIYARESLTYEFFKSLGLKNVCLFPDPAFILQEEKCSLPDCFSLNAGDGISGNVIGINVSYYVLKNKGFEQEITKLINHILKDTDSRILFIPHVTWKFPNDNQDDREVSRMFAEKFNNDTRISILDIDDMNYCQIRYVISKCRFFIGARTHAAISAYSTCTPTIALGYSIKSRGIAKDLGLDERMVVNSKDYAMDELCLSFDYMLDNESDIRNHLHNIMPGYKSRTFGIRECLKDGLL